MCNSNRGCGWPIDKSNYGHMAIKSGVAMIAFKEKELLGNLSRISLRARTAFAIACATRLLPGYLDFCRDTGLGDPVWMSEITDRVWRDLKGNEINATELHEAIVYCEQLVPGEGQDFGTPLQERADDAAAAVAYALRCRQDGSEKSAAWASRRAIETLDRTLTEGKFGEYELDDEERLLSHPLIQAELKRQTRDIDELMMTTDDELPALVSIAEPRAKAEAMIFWGHRSA